MYFTWREIKEIEALLADLARTLLEMADAHGETIMPGCCPFAEGPTDFFRPPLLAYFEMLLRDLGRLEDTYKRLDVMPLGSGALAGTVFPLDRDMVKEELGFSAITANSLDGVADDFALEFFLLRRLS